jgi:hypothetical protein
MRVCALTGHAMILDHGRSCVRLSPMVA